MEVLFVPCRATHHNSWINSLGPPALVRRKGWPKAHCPIFVSHVFQKWFLAVAFLRKSNFLRRAFGQHAFVCFKGRLSTQRSRVQPWRAWALALQRFPGKKRPVAPMAPLAGEVVEETSACQVLHTWHTYKIPMTISSIKWGGSTYTIKRFEVPLLGGLGANFIEDMCVLLCIIEFQSRLWIALCQWLQRNAPWQEDLWTGNLREYIENNRQDFALWL